MGDQRREYIENPAAPNVSYYTPQTSPPAGTALDAPDGKDMPLLFGPLTIRGVTFQNRIFVSPMCQYSADDGHHTFWHWAHLGGIISRGPGLTIVEATSVTPEGRITPQDSGIWDDSQIEPLRKSVEFAHSQGQKIAIQLAHAGRKASTVAPWLSRKAVATEKAGGWPDNVLAPSAIAFAPETYVPKAMTLSQIEDFKKAWVSGVKRSLKAGFDVIEIHSAHGYLLHSFLSPVSNVRPADDPYTGTTFEGRTRLLMELIELTRSNMPGNMPLFVRISGTDWLDGLPQYQGTNADGSGKSWTAPDTVKLCEMIARTGAVDLVDISSGGNHPDQQITAKPGYHRPLAEPIRKALTEAGSPMLVGVVGLITSGTLAEQFLEEGVSDVVLVARGFQENPSLVWSWAHELGVGITAANQIAWGFGGGPGKAVRKH